MNALPWSLPLLFANLRPVVGPRLAFNLGVELGQLALVAIFVPLAWWLRPTRAYRRLAIGPGSALIAAWALVWLTERALDLDWAAAT